MLFSLKLNGPQWDAYCSHNPVGDLRGTSDFHVGSRQHPMHRDACIPKDLPPTTGSQWDPPTGIQQPKISGGSRGTPTGCQGIPTGPSGADRADPSGTPRDPKNGAEAIPNTAGSQHGDPSQGILRMEGIPTESQKLRSRRIPPLGSHAGIPTDLPGS